MAEVTLMKRIQCLISAMLLVYSSLLHTTKGQTCVQFQLTEQPPRQLDCNPFILQSGRGGSRHEWNLETSCTVERIERDSTTDYELHWFQKHANGTTEDRGRPGFFTEMANRHVTRFGNHLFGDTFTDAMVGEYWCQVVLEPQGTLLGTGNTITVLPPESYASSIPECTGVIATASTVCVDSSSTSVATEVTTLHSSSEMYSTIIQTTTSQSTTTVSSITSTQTSNQIIMTQSPNEISTADPIRSSASKITYTSAASSVTTLRGYTTSDNTITKTTIPINTISTTTTRVRSQVTQSTSYKPSPSLLTSSRSMPSETTKTQVINKNKATLENGYRSMNTTEAQPSNNDDSKEDFPVGMVVAITVLGVVLTVVIVLFVCVIVMIVLTTRNRKSQTARPEKLSANSIEDIINTVALKDNPTYSSLNINAPEDDTHYYIDGGRESRATINSSDYNQLSPGMSSATMPQKQNEKPTYVNTTNRFLTVRREQGPDMGTGPYYENIRFHTRNTSQTSLIGSQTRTQRGQPRMVASTEHLVENNRERSKAMTSPRYQNVNCGLLKESHTYANMAQSVPCLLHTYANCTISPAVSLEQIEDRRRQLKDVTNDKNQRIDAKLKQNRKF